MQCRRSKGGCMNLVLQGIQRFPPQLCQALTSSYVNAMKCPFNDVIYTSHEFFWHIKHNGTFIISWVMVGNSFWQYLSKTEFFPYLTLHQKNELSKMPTIEQFGILFFIFTMIFMDIKYPWVLICEQECNVIFLWMLIWRKNFVFRKFCQKLFPPLTHELRKVSWCYICQKNSRGVKITWLKGNFIASTYEHTRAWQSWGGNRWTPCMCNTLFPIL